MNRPDQRLSRHQRLTFSRYFREAYDQRCNRVGRYMVLWLRRGEDASLRLGVVASRKVGNAVKRARARRILREAYRRNRHLFSGSHDVVLVARRALLSAQWDDVVAELLRLAGGIGLIDESPPQTGKDD
jgi:ribonuclease P protein component